MNTFLSVFWLGVLLGFQFGAAPAPSMSRQVKYDPAIAATAFFLPQESTPQLDEAAQLTRSVVKLFSEAKYMEALPLAKRALELREAALGPDHELVQVSRLNLSEIYLATKKYSEALKLVERLLKTHEAKVGPDDAGAALYLEKLGFLAYVQGDFNKSEAAYKRALVIQEKAFGKEHAEYANALFSLAEFYRFRNKLDTAEPLYEQAAILRRKLLGRQNPEYQKTQDRYFCLAYLTNHPERVKDFAAKLGDSLNPDKPPGFGDILNGRAISLPKPEYSEEARRQHASGTVIIKVTVDEFGKVTDAADMCSGDPLLVKPSIGSALKARFTPTKLSGQPVKVSGVITYNYVVR